MSLKGLISDLLSSEINCAANGKFQTIEKSRRRAGIGAFAERRRSISELSRADSWLTAPKLRVVLQSIDLRLISKCVNIWPWTISGPLIRKSAEQKSSGSETPMRKLWLEGKLRAKN